MNSDHDSASSADPAVPMADEKNNWPEEVFPFDDARQWIIAESCLPETTALRVVAVYASYADATDQRLTARVALTDVHGAEHEIVIKDSRFPLVSGSARAHAFLSRLCPGLVPHVLAWDEDRTRGGCRFIYRPFEGYPADDGDPALLAQTARTLAHIQRAVAASGKAEIVDLPRVTEHAIASIFDQVRSHIAAHLPAWQADEDGKLTKALGFPAADVPDVLAAARPQVGRCVEEVASLALAPSIDHGDLHGGNAMVQANGAVLIYDWETATIGCPLFSLERLLVAGWRLDENPEGGGPWGYVSDTPTQAFLRDAYRDALGMSQIHDRVFAAAMALATVKEMHTEIPWANLMGWPDGNPEWTAQLISRFRQHLRDWRG